MEYEKVNDEVMRVKTEREIPKKEIIKKKAKLNQKLEELNKMLYVFTDDEKIAVI